MQKIIAVLVLAVFACGAANASDKTDAMAVVHKWVDSFNKGDGKTAAVTLLSSCEGGRRPIFLCA
jgi:hypothetical protein